MIVNNQNERLLKFLQASPDQQAEIDKILTGQPRTEQAKGPLLLTMSEASRLLNVSRATLWRCVRAGRLQKVELFTNSFRLRYADVEALVQGKKVAHEAHPE